MRSVLSAMEMVSQCKALSRLKNKLQMGKEASPIHYLNMLSI